MRRNERPLRRCGLPTLRAACAVAALCAGAVSAQSPPQPSQPQPQQQATDVSVPARAELERHRATLAQMQPGERDDFRQRIAEWDAQTPALQRARRAQWQAWQALPAAEQGTLQAEAAAFSTRPADQQQALRATYQALDASEQRGWLLGPTLGLIYPRLYALLAQVPAQQRDVALATLRTMTDDEREALAVLAQRTPPQERDALRQRWLSLPEPQRAGWLQAQVKR